MNPLVFGDVIQNNFTSSLTHNLCLNSKVKDHFNKLTLTSSVSGLTSYNIIYFISALLETACNHANKGNNF